MMKKKKMNNKEKQDNNLNDLINYLEEKNKFNKIIKQVQNEEKIELKKNKKKEINNYLKKLNKKYDHFRLSSKKIEDIHKIIQKYLFKLNQRVIFIKDLIKKEQENVNNYLKLLNNLKILKKKSDSLIEFRKNLTNIEEKIFEDTNFIFNEKLNILKDIDKEDLKQAKNINQAKEFVLKKIKYLLSEEKKLPDVDIKILKKYIKNKEKNIKYLNNILEKIKIKIEEILNKKHSYGLKEDELIKKFIQNNWKE